MRLMSLVVVLGRVLRRIWQWNLGRADSSLVSAFLPGAYLIVDRPQRRAGEDAPGQHDSMGEALADVEKRFEGEWFAHECPLEPGGNGYKETTSCPTTGSYVGHCVYSSGQIGETHEYEYDVYDDMDAEDLRLLKEWCTEDGEGVWVGR